MYTQSAFITLVLSGAAIAAPAVFRRDDCATACTNAYNTCRGDTSNPRSTCSSNYASCLGFSPFDGSGSLVEPTACSITTGVPTATAAPTFAGICNAAAQARGDCTATNAIVPTATATSEPSCMDKYNTCIANGTPEVACQCTLASCSGEDNARNRAYCATATAGLPATTAAPTFAGICNAAAQARGDCTATNAIVPSATSTATPDACASACSNAYNTCRSASDANRATCASNYSNCLGYSPFNDSGSLVTPTSCIITTAVPAATPAPVFAGICNAAAQARGDCTATTAIVPTAAPAAASVPNAAAAPVAAAPAATATASTTGWTVEHLTRYCAEDKTGCDYNFALNTNDGVPTENCTIIRTNIPDATTESFYDVPCTTNSSTRISWGYSAQFGVDSAFAVLTAVNYQQKASAYFGVANVNSQNVTAGNPFGSGNYGNIGPQTVYLF